MPLSLSAAKHASRLITPKVIENGVIVPPGLQINALTLEEHQVKCRTARVPLPSREDAQRIGHRQDEVVAMFGGRIAAVEIANFLSE